MVWFLMICHRQDGFSVLEPIWRCTVDLDGGPRQRGRRGAQLVEQAKCGGPAFAEGAPSETCPTVQSVDLLWGKNWSLIAVIDFLAGPDLSTVNPGNGVRRRMQ